MTLKGRFERIGYLLEGFPELDELRVRSNAVIARLPGTREGRLVERALPDGRSIVLSGAKADAERAIYGRDIWLHYHSRSTPIPSPMSTSLRAPGPCCRESIRNIAPDAWYGVGHAALALFPGNLHSCTPRGAARPRK